MNLIGAEGYPNIAEWTFSNFAQIQGERHLIHVNTIGYFAAHKDNNLIVKNGSIVLFRFCFCALVLIEICAIILFKRNWNSMIIGENQLGKEKNWAYG